MLCIDRRYGRVKRPTGQDTLAPSAWPNLGCIIVMSCFNPDCVNIITLICYCKRITSPGSSNMLIFYCCSLLYDSPLRPHSLFWVEAVIDVWPWVLYIPPRALCYTVASHSWCHSPPQLNLIDPTRARKPPSAGAAVCRGTYRH